MPQLCSDFGISGLTLPIISAQPGAAEDSVEKLHGAQVKLSGAYGEKSLYLTALNSNCRPTWAEHTGGDVTMRKMCVICSFSLVIYAQKNMLTWSLAFLSASKSFCNLSALSSAPSAWSCKDLIFRLTASSDVVPAIVYSHKLKKKKRTTLWAASQFPRNRQGTRWRPWLGWKLREDRLDSAQALWRRGLLLLVQEVLLISKRA